MVSYKPSELKWKKKTTVATMATIGEEDQGGEDSGVFLNGLRWRPCIIACCVWRG
jgi:hypothetical protein